MSTYGINDLVEARIDAHRYARAHTDLATSRRARYRAMAAAFGLPGDDELSPVGGRGNDWYFDGLTRSTLSSVGRLDSPFAGYLEAPAVIIDLHHRFAGPIDQGISMAREAMCALLAEIMIRRYRLDPEATVTDADLAAHGFDSTAPWPDEFDYL